MRTTLRVVDAWMQHPTARFLEDPMFESLKRWGAFPAVPDEAVKVRSTVAALDRAGAQTGLVSAWYGPGKTLVSNNEVHQAVAQSDGRLVGVGSVDISKPMEAVREAQRCVRELGFKAIRVLPWLWDVPPTDRRFYPVYVACCQLNVPFCTQVGHTGPMASSEVGRPIYLDRVALDFPDLVIVGGHIGYPWTDEAIAVATKHNNVYIDTSAYKVKRYPRQLVDFIKTNGRRKVLFGSNYPMIEPADCLEGLDELGLDDATKALFLGGNSDRVFRLSPSTKANL